MTPHAARATQALFEEHGAAVYRFAVALLRHHQDAEDVLQETFLKLLQHLQRDGSAENLRGWIFTVAAHAACDRQRRRARWQPWTPFHDAGVEPPPLEDEDGRLRTVREVLRRLRPRDRLLLALRAQGLSYRDIAAASGIRPSSVGRLLARAVDRWRAEHESVEIAAGSTRSEGVGSYEMSQRSQDSGGRR
ncbi:MAG TPA: sigma-70 family RNA polymerase sigma factor [Vicinamibacterales bacterium]|nr:sigma-70 family RNA polymerase sigma factor [Vicinamibacterales bacterium]